MQPPRAERALVRSYPELPLWRAPPGDGGARADELADARALLLPPRLRSGQRGGLSSGAEIWASRARTAGFLRFLGTTDSPDDPNMQTTWQALETALGNCGSAQAVQAILDAHLEYLAARFPESGLKRIRKGRKSSRPLATLGGCGALIGLASAAA